MSTQSAGTPTSAPSTPPGVEPVVAGATGVTFDELEAVTAPVKKESAPKKKESKEPKESKAKTREEEGDAESEAETKEEKELENESKDESKEDRNQETSKKGDKKEEVKAPKVKNYKIKVGDAEVDVPATTEFEVTVNGKAEKVPVSELLSNYAGKTDWTRKYTELDKERKSFHSERDSLTGSINKLYDLAVKQNDPGQAIAFLTEAMGGNALEVMKQLRASFWQEFERHKDLSPEQRESLETRQELEFLKKRDSDRASAERAREIEAQVSSRVKAIQEAHNLTDEGFYKAYEALKNSGHVEPSKITPELVGKWITTKKEFDTLGQMIKEADPESTATDKDVEDLLRQMRVNGLALEDMKDVIAQVYGKPKASGKLAKKIKSSAGKSAGASNPKSEPFSWDEI